MKKILMTLGMIGLAASLPDLGFGQNEQPSSSGAQAQPAQAQTQPPAQPAQAQAQATGVQAQGAQQLIESLPLLEIKRLETERPLYSMELRNVDLADFFRVIAHDYELNFLVDGQFVSGKVTASLTNVSLEEALDQIAQMHNLVLEKKGKIIVVRPNLITKVFMLKHASAEQLLGKTSAAAGAAAAQPAAAGATGQQAGTQATIYSLLSPVGKALLGKQPNSIMVIDYPANMANVDEYVKMVDKGMAVKVFKLKYINAQELVTGVQSSTVPGASGTAAGLAPADSSGTTPATAP